MTTQTKEPLAPTREEVPAPEQPKEVIGRLVPSVTAPSDLLERSKPPIVLFCHESPDSFIGAHVARIVPLLAKRGRKVHLFCQHPFVVDDLRVQVHNVGAGDATDVIEEVQQFTSRASNAFLKAIPASEPVYLVGYEWTSAPVLSLLKGLRNLPTMLSLYSLERQRSDLTSEVSRKIFEIEQEALQKVNTLLIHEQATAEIARQEVPNCIERIVHARHVFPMTNFEATLDAGVIKARYQVGPIDPMLLYIGDLDERYGPDALLRAMPAILRHHPQARLVIVGDGQLFWPLKVYTRYLLLEHAVRLLGDVRDKALNELIMASDVVVVPSRESTPWWPIQAAWAARKPVVATHDAARGLTEHEKDSVLIYPSENSVVWGVERVLYDEELRKSIGAAGRDKLEERFGWNGLAEQMEELLLAVS